MQQGFSKMDFFRETQVVIAKEDRMTKQSGGCQFKIYGASICSTQMTCPDVPARPRRAGRPARENEEKTQKNLPAPQLVGLLAHTAVGPFFAQEGHWLRRCGVQRAPDGTTITPRSNGPGAALPGLPAGFEAGYYGAV